MSIDLQAEELLSLGDAAKSLPAIEGRRPHISTLWRWCKKGVRGVRLEYVRLGHRVCTSREALSRFAQRLAEVDDKPGPGYVGSRGSRRRSINDRKRAVERAERRLDAAGA